MDVEFKASLVYKRQECIKHIAVLGDPRAPHEHSTNKNRYPHQLTCFEGIYVDLPLFVS